MALELGPHSLSEQQLWGPRSVSVFLIHEKHSPPMAALSRNLSHLPQGPDGYPGEAGSPGEQGDQGAKVRTWLDTVLEQAITTLINPCLGAPYAQLRSG